MRAGYLLFPLLLIGCRNQETSSAPGAPPGTTPAAPVVSASPPSATASPPVTSTSTAANPAPPGSKSWDFESDTAGSAPKGFSFGRTGSGREGKWLVRAETGAPSGKNVLAQSDDDPTDYRFPVAFADEPLVKNLELSVRCKPVSGKVDQACGLVFRLKDSDNYYLTRANALEGNVRLYFVKNGKRQEIATFKGKVTTDWHLYRLVAKDDHFEVYWDGAKVLDHHDKTFGDAGKVGLWTKADSVTLFDDLSVKSLD